MTLAGAAVRGGRLLCLCPEDGESGGEASAATLVLLAVGFALSALSQALAAGILPLAAAPMVGAGVLSALPYAVLLLGTAVASLPASLLVDRLGRREGLALGASLGVAGGLMVALAVVQGRYPILVLGSFWLGIAQGFGLFYRHLAAGTAGRMAAGPAVGLVVGAGLFAGVVGPTLAGHAEGLAAPYLYVGSAALAAALHAAMMLTALALPPARWVAETDDARSAAAPAVALGPATAGSAAAWFLMAAVMAAAPLGMAGCGFTGGSIVGAMAWHVVAMYAPALAAGPLTLRFGPLPVVLFGLAAGLAGAVVVAGATAEATFSIGLALAGAGWSLATVGSTALLAAGPVGRGRLALHDGASVIAALAGALLAATLA